MTGVQTCALPISILQISAAIAGLALPVKTTKSELGVLAMVDMMTCCANHNDGATASSAFETLAGEEGLEPSHAGIKIRCLNQLGDSPTPVDGLRHRP